MISGIIMFVFINALLSVDVAPRTYIGHYFDFAMYVGLTVLTLPDVINIFFRIIIFKF